MENYVGELRIFAGNYAPQGWHLCDGSLLPINEYEALYTLLGTAFGGNGQTTFGLPDLRGRVPIHNGTGRALTQVTLGQLAGTEKVTLTAANLPAHSHTLMATAAAGTVSSPAGAVVATATKPVYVTNATPPSDTLPTPVAMNGASVSLAGGTTPVSIIQPSTVVNYIIAIVGIYPSQN
jgi:microcystin-dependent protein